MRHLINVAQVLSARSLAPTKAATREGVWPTDRTDIARGAIVHIYEPPKWAERRATSVAARGAGDREWKSKSVPKRRTRGSIAPWR